MHGLFMLGICGQICGETSGHFIPYHKACLVCFTGSLAAAGMYKDRQANPLGQQTLILTDSICQSYP